MKRSVFSSKKISFIDYPEKIHFADYDNLKSRLVKALMKQENVLSVYQIGSVGHPGISDLDLICVFKDGSSCFTNLRKELNLNEQKILTHGVFGVEESNFSDAINFTLLSNLTFLAGVDGNWEVNNSIRDFDRQIAIEYMIKMLLTLDFQIHIGLVKLRAFLLLAKGIAFDLELLGIQSGNLYVNVEKVMKYRDTWFESNYTDKEMEDFILEFRDSLEEAVQREVEKSTFYLPKIRNRVNGVFEINKGKKFHTGYSGLRFPGQLRFLGRRYISLQFRTSISTLTIPYEIPEVGSPENKRFLFDQKLVLNNRSRFPHFIPLTTSLCVH